MLSKAVRGCGTLYRHRPRTMTDQYEISIEVRSAYIVPVCATHLQRAVTLLGKHVDVAVTKNVGEREATFPNAAPTSGIKMEAIAF
jgi:hypothetical protein